MVEELLVVLAWVRISMLLRGEWTVSEMFAFTPQKFLLVVPKKCEVMFGQKTVQLSMETHVLLE